MTHHTDRLEQMLRDIERDNISGSVKMAEKAAQLLEEVAAGAGDSSPDVSAEVAAWAANLTFLAVAAGLYLWKRD